MAHAYIIHWLDLDVIESTSEIFVIASHNFNFQEERRKYVSSFSPRLISIINLDMESFLFIYSLYSRRITPDRHWWRASLYRRKKSQSKPNWSWAPLMLVMYSTYQRLNTTAQHRIETERIRPGVWHGCACGREKKILDSESDRRRWGWRP